MTAPLYTREQLDGMGCSMPGCHEDHGPMHFHAACHPGGQTSVYYEQGILVVSCSVCEREIARIGVR